MVRASRLTTLMAVALPALAALAPGAGAQAPCAQTIARDTTLAADAACLAIGADRVTLNLAGHRVQELTVDGHERVTIRDGRVGHLLLRHANRNRLLGLELSEGLELIGSDRNEIAGSDSLNGLGPALDLSDSDRNLIRDSSLRGAQNAAVWMDGASDRNHLLRNQLSASQSSALELSGSRNEIVDNTAVGCCLPGEHVAGINVAGGDRNLVWGNRASGGSAGDPVEGDGIFVAAAASRTEVAFNVADGSPDDGIDVESASTRLGHNSANGNRDLGIEAVPGVRDGGGNTAAGNGNPLQCTNVFCG